MDNEYTVYCYISPNNKKYVGITKQNTNTRAGHNGIRYKKNRYFWAAINKYGWENFLCIKLAINLSRIQACNLEQFYIKFFKSHNSNFGYNLTFGGEANLPTKETRLLISKNHANVSGNLNPFKGKHHTSQAKKLISKNHDYTHAQGINSKISRSPICLENMIIYGSANVANQVFLNKEGCIIQQCCKSLHLYRGLHFIYYDTFMDLYKNNLQKLIDFINSKPKFIRKDTLAQPLNIDNVHDMYTILKQNYDNGVVFDYA